jgi:hypothetical protein
MFYLIRKKKAKVGHTIWFQSKKSRLVYRVKECVSCLLYGSEVLCDSPGWRMKLVRIGGNNAKM